MPTKKDSKKEEKVEVKTTGKYFSAIGRRKTSIARVRLYKKGKGNIVVNDKNVNDYFPNERVSVLQQPLKATSLLKDYDISIVVKGGGVNAQLEASKHGVARALLEADPELREILKTNGFLTRDARRKERKKPGLKKARKAAQWSKR